MRSLTSNPGNILRCVFVRVVRIDELDVGERKVANASLQLPFPLAINVGLGHRDDVTNLKLEGCLVIGIRHACLLHSGPGRKLPLYVSGGDVLDGICS